MSGRIRLLEVLAANVRGVLFDVIFAAGLICWALTLGIGLLALPRYLQWRRDLQEQEGIPYRVVVAPRQLRSEFHVTRALFRRPAAAGGDDENRVAARRYLIGAMRFALGFVGLGILAFADRLV